MGSTSPYPTDSDVPRVWSYPLPLTVQICQGGPHVVVVNRREMPLFSSVNYQSADSNYQHFRILEWSIINSSGDRACARLLWSPQRPSSNSIGHSAKCRGIQNMRVFVCYCHCFTARGAFTISTSKYNSFWLRNWIQTSAI